MSALANPFQTTHVSPAKTPISRSGWFTRNQGILGPPSLGRNWNRSGTTAVVIGVVTAVSILVLQIHDGVIPRNNLHGRLFSILLPYVGVLFAFLLFHLARIPWLISNEHREELESVTVKLRASEQNNALLQEHLSKRNWPENRPRISLDRWGQQVGPHGFCDQSQVFI
jgi:hypothetical protein